MPIPQKSLDELALSVAEYEAIVERLGREPNELELGLFGSLWSEHCGYKYPSRRRQPTLCAQRRERDCTSLWESQHNPYPRRKGYPSGHLFAQPLLRCKSRKGRFSTTQLAFFLLRDECELSRERVVRQSKMVICLNEPNIL